MLCCARQLQSAVRVCSSACIRVVSHPAVSDNVMPTATSVWCGYHSPILALQLRPSKRTSLCCRLSPTYRKTMHQHCRFSRLRLLMHRRCSPAAPLSAFLHISARDTGRVLLDLRPLGHCRQYFLLVRAASQRGDHSYTPPLHSLPHQPFGNSTNIQPRLVPLTFPQPMVRPLCLSRTYRGRHRNISSTSHHTPMLLSNVTAALLMTEALAAPLLLSSFAPLLVWASSVSNLPRPYTGSLFTA